MLLLVGKCIPYLVILKDIPRIYGLKKFQAHLLLKFNVDLHFTKFKTLSTTYSTEKTSNNSRDFLGFRKEAF